MKRRESDADLPPATWDVRLDLEGEDIIALRDALHLALQGPRRRLGDAERWRRLLRRLGDHTTRVYRPTL